MPPVRPQPWASWKFLTDVIQTTVKPKTMRYYSRMDTDASTLLSAPASDPGRAHWIFWEFGLLATLGAIIATPAETNQQAVLAVLCLLFLLGLANQGSEKPENLSQLTSQ